MRFYKGEKLKNLGLIPDMVSRQMGEMTGVFFRDEEQTYNELKRRSKQVASGLIKEGVEEGERVAIYSPNTIQFPETYFGIIKMGAVPVPLNLRLPPKSLKYIIEDANIRTMVASDIETDSFTPSKAKSLLEDTGIEKLIQPGESGENVIDYNEMVQNGDPEFEEVERGYEDTAVQMYTSGTTGKPKGVPLTHKNSLSMIEGFDRITTTDPEDRLLLILPLYHAYGLGVLFGMYLYTGASIVLQAELDIEKLLKNLDKYKCTIFAGVPALYRMMWLVYNQDPEKYKLESLRTVACAASPLDEETRRKVKNAWKVRFEEGWGMTETSPAGTLNLNLVPKTAGCIGWPLPTGIKMKIVDPSTRETLVPWSSIAPWGDLEENQINQEGELAVKGPAVFEGYYNLPEKNEEVFDDEGWFYTGDYMKIDEDKALWMVERTDDMILSGGENIYPSEVEEALMEHSDITDAAVVPAPHKTKGEVPVAFVVLGEGSELTEDEIKEFALERVATYAHPRKVFFRDEIPKSGTLKTQHFKLEEEVKDLISEPLG